MDSIKVMQLVYYGFCFVKEAIVVSLWKTSSLFTPQSLTITEESFRQLLLTVDKERDRLRTETGKLGEAVRERDALIIDQNGEVDRVSRRLHVAEKEIRMLRQKLSLSEHEKQGLQNEVRIACNSLQYIYRKAGLLHSHASL